jgi:hypothetical protein
MVECFIATETSTRLKVFEDRLVFISFIQKIINCSDRNDSKCLLNSLLILNNLFNMKFQKQEYPKLLKIMMKLWGYLGDLIDTPFNSIYVILFDLLNLWG